MEETLRASLIAAGALFEDKTGVSVATVGKRALNDNTFFSRLAAGSGFTIATFDRVVGWLSDNWPGDLSWPKDLPRPEPLPAPISPASERIAP
jgi:hypothetical protein